MKSFAIALGVIALINIVSAGCNVELGFRVQYSDMAILSYVQLQVLSAQNKVLIDNLDNSTREEWDVKRNKNITWLVPQSWPAGEYTLRAFGNAPYACTEGGRPTYCDFLLEEYKTLNVKKLAKGQGCPKIPSESSLGSVLQLSPLAPTFNGTALSSSLNSSNSRNLSAFNTANTGSKNYGWPRLQFVVSLLIWTTMTQLI
ncbi:hypothetical protein BCR41DRAFT_393840 [Lobosporangium transversale]|uniref:Uncharacterized protein n=1 Tax=Lobosporangium transversale TaxID=64571 RepID=A0A1Y2GZ63_9FUNG|nr:hypothetical protein BCR41DRAFT_393840 [Lobosporangium transversale]ORZ24876.1 hypothetical protein BCR41DRAFT_393840 [Lobosporangium transversale]|eukprot:XP_021883857.1 hypothetical protein BCR41DRAFT_393840 [Lobosporangium transversale]